MYVILCKINPKHYNCFKGIIENALIITPKRFKDKIGAQTNFVFLEEYALNEIVKVLQNRNVEFEYAISMTEQDMKMAGSINEYYRKGKYNLGFVEKFRDKYLMRTFLDSTVNQPIFYHPAVIRKEDILSKNKKFLIKPRNMMGSKFITRVTKSSELKDIDDYIIEEYIEPTKVLTVDGICHFGEIDHVFFHEYNKPNLKSIENKNKYRYTRTSNVYNNNIMIENIIYEVKKVLNILGENDITFPFHFEWILNEDRIIFLEVAARFGGDLIPKLIKNAFEFDIVNRYFMLLQNPSIKSKIKILKPKYIACNFMVLKQKAILKQPIVPSQNTLQVTYSTKPMHFDKKAEHTMDIIYQALFAVENEELFNQNVCFYKRQIEKSYDYE